MLSENDEIDTDLLRSIIVRNFGEQTGGLVFQPVGEDSWSYRFGQLWVSVRRDVQGHVPTAYRAAFRLHRDGKEFVLAPLPGTDHEVVRYLAGFPVVVFPFLEAEQITPGLPLSHDERRELERILMVLQHCPRPDGLPTEDFTLPFAEQLGESLATARRRAAGAGPFGARLTALVRTHAGHLNYLCTAQACLAKRLRDRAPQFVLTHGDLNPANVLRTSTGLKIADWGLMKWAPPERDWYHLSRTLRFPKQGEPDLLRYYHLRWQLSEIAEYFAVFTRPHENDEDTQAMWRRLTRYLPESQ